MRLEEMREWERPAQRGPKRLNQQSAESKKAQAAQIFNVHSFTFLKYKASEFVINIILSTFRDNVSHSCVVAVYTRDGN